ncbi:FecR protein [Caulifigura coniformis]|uniref:FecR protein n=1 Tax=Caulifigura coniformis TaxID=2527983 RepID=A0A517SGC0_9PLAN|nr:DNRLRE domain-containing protein [Caulifigura coniformis]QDT55173.1 FecR protein [Caulifigura coniformis]
MSDEFAELRELCDAVFDGRADQSQVDRLEQLAQSSPECTRFYMEYSQQHAALAWGAFHPQHFPIPALCPAPATRWPTIRRQALAWFGIATLVSCAVFVAWSQQPPASPAEFATLQRLQSARWNESTLPIGEGKRLGAGRMELSDGMATIDFDKGVKVILEAPAVFELVDANEFRLHQGKLRAEVRRGGEGFVVRTPTATLVDRGTEFGVHVRVGGVSDLMVFKGKVDAKHRGTGKLVSATTGTGLRLTNQEMEVIHDENAPFRLQGSTAPQPPMQDTIQISTAIGRGMDAYIQPIVPPADRRSDTLLLLKRNNRGFGNETYYDWHRKVYLRFDLGLLDGQEIDTARLELHADRSGMGFAAHCPDARFSVYGLTDEAKDDWGDETLTWNDAPGNFPDGNHMDAARTVYLGTFTIPQGQCSGTFGIDSPELVDFLKTDTNGLTTLMIVRETIGTDISDIVHAFASRRHPTLPAPMLRLTTPSLGAPSRLSASDSAQ